jgi:ferredoxin
MALPGLMCAMTRHACARSRRLNKSDIRIWSAIPLIMKGLVVGRLGTAIAPQSPGELIMAYVITDTCTKDEHCIETCPVNCIHPTKDEADFATATQLYVNPADCIDCGACIPVCPTGSIFALDELPTEQEAFIAKNAAYFN